MLRQPGDVNESKRTRVSWHEDAAQDSDTWDVWRNETITKTDEGELKEGVGGEDHHLPELQVGNLAEQEEETEVAMSSVSVQEETRANVAGFEIQIPVELDSSAGANASSSQEQKRSDNSSKEYDIVISDDEGEQANRERREPAEKNGEMGGDEIELLDWSKEHQCGDDEEVYTKLFEIRLDDMITLERMLCTSFSQYPLHPWVSMKCLLTFLLLRESMMQRYIARKATCLGFLSELFPNIYSDTHPVLQALRWMCIRRILREIEAGHDDPAGPLS